MKGLFKGFPKELIMRYGSLIFAILLLTQCGNYKLVSEAKRETDKMHWDRSFQLWEQLYEANPNNTRAKIQMERSAMEAALRHLQEGLMLIGRRSFEEAKAELNFCLKYEPGNQEAIDALQRIDRMQKEIEQEAKKETEEDNEELMAFYPQLHPSTWEPLNLYFPKSTKIRDIYRALGKNYGINILMDSKVKGDIPYLDLRNLNFIKALDTMMILNRHFFKVIDEKTIVIFEDQQNTRDRYSNQVIKTYYLSNSTPKDMIRHLKVMGDIKHMSENEELNAITIKGTPDQVAMADRIIAANDKAKAEVVIEVELLEVNKNALRDMGIQPVFFDPASPQSTTPMYQAGLYFNPEGSDNSQIRGIFPSISSNDFFTVLPSIMIKLLKENSDSKQIFNPHVRVTAGEEAKIQIGNSVPVAQTAFVNPYETGGNSSLGDRALTTFNYRDAGIDLKVVPRVHHNKDITLDLELSVTSVTGTQNLQPLFGQRIVNTTIRLKNGESTVLAGLLSNDERQSLTGIPGLSDLPILKRLFSSEEKIVKQTDIILMLRPVIVRGANITKEDRAPYEISTLSLSKYQPKQQQGTTETAEKLEQKEVSDSNPGVTVEAPESQNTMEPEENTFSEEPRVEEPVDNEPVVDEPVQEEETEHPAVLAFMPANASVRVDEPKQLTLFMTNVESLYKGEVVLSFDPEIIQIEDLQLERLPVIGGNSPKLTPFWDQESGRASIVISPVKGTQAFSGSGILTSIQIRGLKPGVSDLTIIQSDCETDQGTPIKFQSITGKVEVTP